MNNNKNEKKDMEIPKFDDSEPIEKYLEKMRKFTVSLKKDKYDLVLGFINDVLSHREIKLLKLLDGKKLYPSAFKNIKNNTKVMNKHYKNLSEKLKLEYDYDEDSVSSGEIVDFIKLILNKIEYNIIFNKTETREYYSIIEKPKSTKETLEEFKKRF